MVELIYQWLQDQGNAILQKMAQKMVGGIEKSQIPYREELVFILRNDFGQAVLTLVLLITIVICVIRLFSKEQWSKKVLLALSLLTFMFAFGNMVAEIPQKKVAALKNEVALISFEKLLQERAFLRLAEGEGERYQAWVQLGYIDENFLKATKLSLVQKNGVPQLTYEYEGKTVYTDVPPWELMEALY